MIPEIGQFALILALMLALTLAVLPQIGASRGISQLVAMARPTAQAQFIFVAIAFSCLAYSFINNDFSVLNVATNSNSQLPLQYRLAATWGSHEGSLLLWTFMLTIWMVSVTLFSNHLPDEMVARVLAVMATISTGFLLFMLLTSNPFVRVFPVPADGQDLNPLLQDPAMVAHPPMLYMGYVGFSVAFAFAIAALIGGRLDATWARWSRPWTTVAWGFLTIGIALGSAWAYYELGWGGWWFWDPVENASFMPWLAGAAFAAISRESMLLANNILLIAALGTVMLGTLYPLFLDALGLGKISVGPPYFEAVFVPLMAPLVFLMGIGPLAAWRNASLPDLATRLKWAFGAAIVPAMALPFILGRWTPLIALGVLLSAWVAGSTIVALLQRVRASPQRGFVAKLHAHPRSWYGMLLAHFGVAVFIAGVTLVKGYEVERDVRLNVGQSVAVGGYGFTFRGVAPASGANYDALVGTVDVTREGKTLDTLHPEKRMYVASGQTMTEAAIDTGILGDKYVSLGEPVTESALNGAWGVRIYVKPFVDWIWFGCLLMAVGGFLAISDRRYRLTVKERFAAMVRAAQAA